MDVGTLAASAEVHKLSGEAENINLTMRMADDD